MSEKELVVDEIGAIRIGDDWKGTAFNLSPELAEDDVRLVSLWREAAELIYPEDPDQTVAVFVWRPSGKDEGFIEMGWNFRFKRATLIQGVEAVDRLVNSLQKEGFDAYHMTEYPNLYTVIVQRQRRPSVALNATRFVWTYIKQDHFLRGTVEKNRHHGRTEG